MWADRCTQRPHCALCALNTNDICPSSTTGLSSGYSIKPSSPSSFLPRTLQLQIKCKSRPVRTLSQNRILVESKCFKVHIYRCQAGSSAGLRRADAVHSAPTDPSYSCTGSSCYSYKTWFASASKIFILFERFLLA